MKTYFRNNNNKSPSAGLCGTASGGRISQSPKPVSSKSL